MNTIAIPEQARIIEEATYHILHGNEQVYQFEGPAGTGKTYTIQRIIQNIGIPLHRIAIMAYIGQAAIVMRTRGLWNAKTIHSTLYNFEKQVITDEYGNELIDPTYNRPVVKLVFSPKDLVDVDYIIIDEAGTVPESMKKDIESKGKKIIACGDLGQLPPIEGESAYLTKGKISHLTQVMRQGKGSSILYIADLARRGLPISTGLYGDVLVIEEKDLTNEMISASQIILCGKNKTREKYNNRVRNEILGIHTSLPQYGEKMICRKNDWSTEINGISLANGLIGRVVSELTPDKFNGNQYTIDFQPDLLKSYFPNLLCDYEYLTAPIDKKQLLKYNKYNLAQKFEFAYAATTHLSQGSQHNNGIYISEYLNKDIQPNLNYTGVTRFKHSLIYVVPNKRTYF